MNWKIIMAWHACAILLFSHPTLERQKLFLVSVFIDYLRQEWGIMISGPIPWLALAVGFPPCWPHTPPSSLWTSFTLGKVWARWLSETPSILNYFMSLWVYSICHNHRLTSITYSGKRVKHDIKAASKFHPYCQFARVIISLSAKSPACN